MPFGAIPFGDRYARIKLAHFLGIKGIPSMMIFGPKDNTGHRPMINPNIREVFERGDHLREFPYRPETYGDINRVTEDINGNRFVVVFHEGGDDHEQDEIREALQAASQVYSGERLKMCWAFCFSGLCQSLRSVLRLGQPQESPTMVLLDIPDSGAFYLSDQKDITADTILDFIKSPGARRQI